MSGNVFGIWGAVTGTIGALAGLTALGFNLRHWLLDRPVLKFHADVHWDTESIDSTPQKSLRLSIVNDGHRPISIIFVSVDYIPAPQIWPKDNIVLVSANHKELPAVTIPPDGGRQIVEMPMDEKPGDNYVMKVKHGMAYGEVRLYLTSGREVKCDLPLCSENEVAAWNGTRDRLRTPAPGSTI
jgi:hypothetical protein